MQEILPRRTLNEITARIAELLEANGFKVTFEDDYHDFKDFFAIGSQIFEGAFCALEFVLIQLQEKDGSWVGFEFHIFFFTSKGVKLQRNLSRNDFRVFKEFLESQFFCLAGLKVLEYDPPQPDYRMAKHFSELFPDSIPGVVIRVSGWLDESRT